MLTCSHMPLSARSVREAASQGRFAEALETGIDFLADHRAGTTCRCALAGDLIELAVVIQQDNLIKVLIDVIEDDDVQYLPSRVRTRVPPVAVWAEVRAGRTDDIVDDIREVRGRRPRPLDFRLTMAEVEVRAGLKPRKVPQAGIRLRNSRTRSAAVGLGLALIDHSDHEAGTRWLTSAAEQIERSTGGRPDGSLTETLASAFDAWAWARAVLALSKAKPETKWLLERLPVSARFFAEVGHPRWAAKAETLLAELHRSAGDHPSAAQAARQAIQRAETRFFELGSSASVREWRVTGETAKKIGESATSGDEEQRNFREFKPRSDWLGDPATADEQAMNSATRIRRLYFAGDDVRSTYIQMLGQASETLEAGGSGERLIDHLVEILREDVATGQEPTLLARALTLRAHHRHRVGLPKMALADDAEARSLLLSENTEHATRAADEHLERRIDGLLTERSWAAAVRTAVTFDSSKIDPIRRVEDQALLRNRNDVIEQLAAFRVELAHTGSRRSLVAALSSWAVVRERLSAGAGIPIFDEAITVAEASSGQDEDSLATLIEARLLASRYRADTEFRILLQRALRDSFTNMPLLAELADAVAGVATLKPEVTVELLVKTGQRLVTEGPTAGRGSAWVSDHVLRWADTIHGLHAPMAAAGLYRALTQLQQLPDFLMVAAQIRLASSLADTEHSVAAVAAATRAVELDPDSAQAHRILGEALLRHSALTDAKRALDLALHLNAESARGHYLRAEVLRRSGDLEGARADAAEAVRLAPRYEAAATLYSRVLRSREEYERALAVLDAVGAGQSTFAWTRYQYGLAMAATGDRRQANELFLDALEIGVVPVHVVGRFKRAGDPNLGLFLLALGRSGVSEELRAALDPTTPDWLLREMVEDFEELAAVLPERREAASHAAAVLTEQRLS